MRFLFLFIFISCCLVAQNNCPPGTEQIWVKCNGVLVERCVPSKEDCGCEWWAVDYYHAKDHHIWGSASDALYSKVEQQLAKDLQWEKNPDHASSTLVYYLHSEIYCQRGKLCNSTKLNSSLYDKIIIAVKELRAKLAELKQAYNDFPIVERAKPGLVGYIKFIQDAEVAADKAYDKAMEYQKQPTTELEQFLDEQSHELNNYYLGASEKMMYMQSENVKRSEALISQKNTANTQITQQQIDAQNKAAQQQALNNYYQYQQDQYKQSSQNIDQSFNQLKGAINALGQGSSQSNQYEINKLQNEIEARKKAEAEEKEKQRQKELVIEKQKLEQQKDIVFWKGKSNSVLSNQGIINKGNMPDDLGSAKMDTVYFIFWNFNTESNIKISSPVIVTKSADGDWPAMRDIKNTVIKNYGFKMSATPYGTQTSEDNLNYVLGYFRYIEEANAAFNKLQDKANANGYLIQKIDIMLNKPEKKTSSADFWKE